MSNTATLGHNVPPITAPSDEELLADLRRRFPELETSLTDFEEALKTYPEKLTLEDEPVAAALQDVLGKIKKQQSIIAAHKKTEKKPWDGMVKVVQNFFAKYDERLDAFVEKWEPRHKDFMQMKKADAELKAAEAAETQRKESERLNAEALAAETRAEEARQREAAALKREEEAHQRAITEENNRREAEAATERARVEEVRIAKEKRERESAERDLNKANLREIRTQMKTAERLHVLAEAEEATPEEAAQLDGLIKAGGIVSSLANPVANSALLDDEQKTEVETLRARLAELRKAINDRFDAKERKRRKKESDAAEAREAAAAAERNKRRDEETARAEKARLERERLQTEADAAKEREKAAKTEVKDARAEGRGAIAEQRDAGRDARRLGTDADRAENRADRMDRKLETGTSTPLRGDLGTVGSLTGRWKYQVTDEDALRAASGPLGEHFTSDALAGAAYRWMGAHRDRFTGERVDDALPGVLFFWEEDGRIVA